MTNGLSIGLSFVLGVFVAAGMGFYWVCSNLSSIAIQALANVLVKPREYIDYEDLEAAAPSLRSSRTRPQGRRNGTSATRLPSARRPTTSASSRLSVSTSSSTPRSWLLQVLPGRYRVAARALRCRHPLRDERPQRPGVHAGRGSEPRLKPYYIGQRKIITLMMKMDADLVVSTLEDLDNYYIKRSYIRKDIEYVFMFHHMTSTHLTPQAGVRPLRHGAVRGPPPGARAAPRRGALPAPAKNLVECGYDLLDREIAEYEPLLLRSRSTAPRGAHRAVVAGGQHPRHLHRRHAEKRARARHARFIVPHTPNTRSAIPPGGTPFWAHWASVPEYDLYFEHDFSSNKTVFTSDILVTDWSSIC